MKVVDKGLKEKIWTRRERYKNMNLVANLTHLRKEAKGTKTDSKCHSSRDSTVKRVVVVTRRGWRDRSRLGNFRKINIREGQRDRPLSPERELGDGNRSGRGRVGVSGSCPQLRVRKASPFATNRNGTGSNAVKRRQN